MLGDDERYREYIGAFLSKNNRDLQKVQKVELSVPYICHQPHLKELLFCHGEENKEFAPHYTRDLMHWFQCAQVTPGSYYLACLCDNTSDFPFPVMAKSAPVESNCVILKLNKYYHYKYIKRALQDSLLFEQKKNEIVWRGSSTGWNRLSAVLTNRASRKNLIQKFYMVKKKGIDVALTRWCQKEDLPENILLEKEMSIEEQMGYKFILSVEGNDVGTNVKWILGSNSVLVMPPPTMRTWFLENRLVPGVHYIAIKPDFSDLEEKLQWGLEHEEECKKMSRNGKLWVRMFLDEEKEKLLHTRVLQTYFSCLSFSLDPMTPEKTVEIVEKLYREKLGRNPDPSGLKCYTQNLLRYQLDAWGMEKALENSDEYKKSKKVYRDDSRNYNPKEALAIVRELYLKIFLREADSEGEKHYTEMLITGQITTKELENVFLQSDERKKIVFHCK